MLDDKRRYMLMLKDAGYSIATIATHHKELKVFYNFLLNEEHVTKNPTTPIKAPKQPRVYPYVLSEEEIDKLLKVTNGNTFEAKRNYAILLTFIDTAIRVSELCSLKLEDVCFATYTIKINQGKGGKDRVVHFSKDTAKALSSYIKKRGFVAHEDSFFLTKQNNSLSRDTVFRIIKKLGVKACIDRKRRVSPHTLRHTSATFWIKNGGDPVSLQRQLGQNDPRMVDVYVNLVGRDLKEAHSKYSPLQRVLGRK